MGQEVVIRADDGTEHVFPPGFDPKRAAGIVRQQSTAPPSAATPPDTSNLERLAAWLPTVGGMVGGAVGGIPGAAAGGAAGHGYEQLVTKAREIPGAVKDVASNLVAQPGATLKGAASGTWQGIKDTGLEGGLQALYELGGKMVSGALSTGGRAVYRGYLKPGLSERLLPKAKEIVETGIREGITVTEGGAAKAEQLTTALKNEVDRILANTKGEVNLSEVADGVRAFAKREYYRPGKPLEDYKAAMKVADELDLHPSLANPFAPQTPATAHLPTANSIKRGVGQSIGETNFGIDRGATKSAQKETYHGLRAAIEDRVVKSGGKDIGPLNTRESKLIDLTDALNKATGREGNRNQLFGVPTITAAAGGAAELAAGTGRYGAGAMALAIRIGLTPTVATRAAIIAAKLGDQLPGTAVADVARMAVQAVSEAQK